MPDSPESQQRLLPKGPTMNRQSATSALVYSDTVAEMLGITRHTLHKLAEVGKAPAPVGRDGAKNVYDTGDVEAFMRTREAGKARTGRCRAAQCRGTGTRQRGGLCPRHGRAYAVLGPAALTLVLPPWGRDATLTTRLERAAIDDPVTGCRIWIGTTTADGYGQVTDADGRVLPVHRVALEAALGRPLAPGMEPDHVCERRACVRPSHLVEATHAENVQRRTESARRRRLAEQEAYAAGAVTLDADLEDALAAAHREQQAAA